MKVNDSWIVIYPQGITSGRVEELTAAKIHGLTVLEFLSFVCLKSWTGKSSWYDKTISQPAFHMICSCFFSCRSVLGKSWINQHSYCFYTVWSEINYHLYCSYAGWSNKAALTWKYLVNKFPENLELQRQWGVSYLMVGQNERARDVFKQVDMVKHSLEFPCISR